MEDKKMMLLLGVAAAAAAYWYWSNNQNSDTGIGTERQYRLPSGRVVFESQLPSLGYTRTPQGWVDSAAYNALKEKLKQGFDWETALKSVVNTFGQISDLTGKNKLKVDGKRVDTNTPFSVPADWGLSDDGSVLAGYRSQQILLNNQNVFNQLQF